MSVGARAYLRKQMASPAAPVDGEASPAPAPARTAPPAVPLVDTTGAPPCPKCGSRMVLRVVSGEGPQKGKQFWGCPNYPKCRGMRRLEDWPRSKR
jgi:hypothetical protein